MKTTGIMRRIDDLGCVVIPKEFRRLLNWHDGDPIEMFTEDGGVVCLKKHVPSGVSGIKQIESDLRHLMEEMEDQETYGLLGKALKSLVAANKHSEKEGKTGDHL